MAADIWAGGDAYEAYVGRWSRVVAREFVRGLSGERWLDVGCGTGALTAAAQESRAAEAEAEGEGAGRPGEGVGGGDEGWTVAGEGAAAAGEGRALPGEGGPVAGEGGPVAGEGRAVVGEGGPAAAGEGAAARAGWVVGVDPSEAFVRQNRTTRVVGDGTALPFGRGVFDVVVSGLALNFMADPQLGVDEMARVAREGGVVTAYVWDYAEGMQLMRHFWDAVEDRGRDEAARFPICRPDALEDAWRGAGLQDVRTGHITIPTVFADFDDYWRPFLGGAGAAPGYLLSLPEDKQAELRERVRETLPRGEIRLTARAWTVRGTKNARRTK